MSTWLDLNQALALIEQEVDSVDPNSFEGALDAACALVERKRPDLWVEVPAEDPEDPPVVVFAADAAIRLGAAMLTHRLWERRSSPLGAAQFTEFGAGAILRYDPDIGRLLGIGTEGTFNFGAAGYVPEVVEEVV